jgi:tRNA dimethylallyltransferase
MTAGAPSSPSMVIVVGPTAAGKTQLAISLAAASGGEVLSADSQQVYRGMDIGTGKASAGEQATIRHHLLDVVDPDGEMTAARFVELADAVITDCARRAVPLIVCGGTGLYVRALMLGLFAGPPANPELRAELTATARAHGVAALFTELSRVDPVLAARTQPQDELRIIRALEVMRLTGEPMSSHQLRHDHRTIAPRYRARWIGLAPPRPQLYPRIEERVERMMAAGLLAEVERLRARGFTPPLRSQQAIGYAELHQHLEGTLELPRAVELIKRNSRHYARRQLSWYRRDTQIEWSEQGAQVDLEGLRRYLSPEFT